LLTLKLRVLFKVGATPVMSFIRLMSSDRTFRAVIPIKFSHIRTKFGNLWVSALEITSTWHLWHQLS